jgi:hypothetical protein
MLDFERTKSARSGSKTDRVADKGFETVFGCRKFKRNIYRLIKNKV